VSAAGGPTGPAVSMKRITKRFPGVLANDHIDLDVEAGEIHAVVGENGAGKSTLMKILYGLYPPDGGEICIGGTPVQIDSPRKAVSLGIGMVHQHFMLVDRFTVTENVVLGQEPTGPAGALRMRDARDRVRRLCEQYGFALDPSAPVSSLSVGERQRVEILKVLYRGADVLILDEPTAVLVPQEVRDLFDNLRRLKGQGKTIIFIGHKLDEVLEIADRVSVLRDGKMMGTVEASATDRPSIARMMVGRPVLFRLEKPDVTPGDPVLEVQDLTVERERGRPAARRVSFSVREGEVYGIAGVEGNGQLELVEGIVGLRPIASGRVLISGVDAAGSTVRDVRLMGVAYIPEDRHRRGLALQMKVWENAVLGYHRRKEITAGPFLRFASILPGVQRTVDEYDVRVSSLFTPAYALSGGNQQKLIVAREFSRNPRLLVAAHPTRGLDVGATEFVRGRILDAVREGRAVLLLSADLDEVMSLSDRIGVMHRGELVVEFDADAVSAEELGAWMLGAGEGAGGGPSRSDEGGGRR